MASEAAFEITKDKVQVAVKNKNLYLMHSELLTNVFFTNQLKADVMKFVLLRHMYFPFSFDLWIGITNQQAEMLNLT